MPNYFQITKYVKSNLYHMIHNYNTTFLKKSTEKKRQITLKVNIKKPKNGEVLPSLSYKT